MTSSARPLGPLPTGARVALVAPAGPVVPELVDRASTLLRSWGLEPVEGRHLRGVHPRASYLAGTDEGRAADLVEAWCDPSIEGIFCVRGGYGSVRLLDHLDATSLRSARPKPLYGSSDVTALHEYWREVVGVPTWFTPMVGTLSLLDDPAATASLRRAVVEPFRARVYSSEGAETLIPGTASGTLIGGTLTMLAMTAGTRSAPPRAPGPFVALLEDVDEKPYRIDGLLVSLLRSGWFDGVTGVVLGSWLDCGQPEEVRAVCAELLAPLGIPVAWELGFGHAAAAESVPLGVSAVLDASIPSLTIVDTATIH
ncbi:LD-carboxypeptidase [Mumia sp.]|uniref:S66 peptidase family protein n=1 Tax=Mumia sp. TaxID=1965300 RepID=UPI002603A53B|nr:LD-carboxypeptidase [Mumia sp.]MDD9348549.1 LD-carboxypeptidase [Mumia sp.]